MTSPLVTPASHASTGAAAVALSLALVLAHLGAATCGLAHTVTAAQAISRIVSADVKESLGVVSANTDPKLERLLIIRVSDRWQDADVSLRREVAKQWHHLWQSAVPNGVVAVVDDVGGDSLVGYDPEGNASLRRLFADGDRPSQ
jgi:hypothetical protein